MIKILLVLSISLFLNSAFSGDISDKPWREQELEQHVLSNLLINGNFAIYDNKIIESENPLHGPQIIRCWALAPADKIDAFVAKKENHYVIQSIPYHDYVLRGTPIFYTFSDSLKELEVVVTGNLKKNADISAEIVLCKDSCTKNKIKLVQNEKNSMKGVFFDNFGGKYVSNFSLNVGQGVHDISSVFLRDKNHSGKSISDRDRSASRICYNQAGSLTESKFQHFLFLSLFSVFILSLISWYLYKRNYLFSILLSTFFVNSFIGVWGLYFGTSEYRLAQGVRDRDHLVWLAVFNSLCLGLFCVGFELLTRILNKKLKRGKEFFGDLNRTQWGYIYFILAAVLIFSVAPKSLEYFKILRQCDTGSCVMQLAHIRESITEGFSFLKTHYQKLIFFHLTTVISYIMISRWAISGKWIGKTVLLSFIQALILIYNGEKAPVLWYLSGVFFIILSTRISFEDRSRERTVALCLAVSAILISPLFLVGLGSSLADRLLFGSLTVGYHLLNIFPQYSDFLGGRTLSNFGGIFSHEFFDLPFYLWRHIHPEILYTKTRGTSVTAYWGEAYANFGYIGALLSSICLGAVFAVLAKLGNSSKGKNAAVLGFSAWLLFRYTTFTESLFFTFIFDFYLIGVVLFFGALKIIFRLCKIKTRGFCKG